MNDTIRSDNQARLNTLRSEIAHREYIEELLSTADRLKKVAVKPGDTGLRLQILGSGSTRPESTFELDEISVDRRLALFAFAAQLLEQQAADVLKE